MDIGIGIAVVAGGVGAAAGYLIHAGKAVLTPIKDKSEDVGAELERHAEKMATHVNAAALQGELRGSCLTARKSSYWRA